LSHSSLFRKSLNSKRTELAGLIARTKNVLLRRIVSPRLHLVLIVEHVHGDRTGRWRSRYGGNRLSAPDDVVAIMFLDQLCLGLGVRLKCSRTMRLWVHLKCLYQHTAFAALAHGTRNYPADTTQLGCLLG
jgi:hypothetical protein